VTESTLSSMSKKREGCIQLDQEITIIMHCRRRRPYIQKCQ